MHNLSAHIPIDRLQALILETDLPLQAVGAVLMADLSGFTPLTEMLARDLGSRRGMEVLTAVLDQVYDQLVECVHRYRGSVIGFSGDALTAWFSGEDAAPAIACGLAMQRAMEAFATLSLASGHRISLHLKVAISGGLIQRCVVGDPGLHRIDVLAGEPLDRLDKLGQIARQDEVLLDQRLADATSGLAADVARSSEDGAVSGVVVLALTAPVPEQPWETADVPESLAAELQSWIAPAVLARLRDDHQPFLNELRPVGALFVQFTLQAADPAAWRAALDGYVRSVQHILAGYDGTLIQLTIGDKGNYLYAVFGAPIAHEDDTIRMIRAARAISRLPGAALAPPQIGIAQGTARAGIYGGKSRRTYGVLGDAVNLAARLMGQAQPGQILANDLIWSTTPAGIGWDLLPPLSLKGKRQGLIAARLIDDAGESQPGLPAQSSAPLVGRFKELQLVQECLEQSRRGQGQVVVINGEAGIGKSRLINEICQRQPGWQTLSGGGQSYRMTQAYSAWTPIWHQIFGLDPATPTAAASERISAALARWDAASMASLPLLNSVLNLDIPENSLTAGLEAKLRKALLERLLTTCFRSYATDMALAGRPVLVVIEDAHWLDQLSLDLLDQIGQAVGGLAAALVATTRPGGAASASLLERLAEQPHARSMTLPELAPAEVSDLLAQRWRQLNPQASGMSLERLSEQVIPRASGNPFYIEELISFLAASATPLDEHTGWQGVELPLGLHRLVLSRVDRLDAHHQRVLKVASVLGAEFPRAWLEECYPGGDPAGRIDDDLAVLQRHELLIANPESGLCQFRHSITQEVTYESLAQRTRQDLHEQVAMHLEGDAGPIGDHLNLLAYHYERSPNDGKALWYMARNAERAARLFANRDAVRHYQTALERAAGSRAELPFPAETLPRGLGDVYAQMAEFDAALERYHQALGLLPADDHLGRAEMHLQRADVLARATRFDEAEGEIDQAEQLIRPADQDQGSHAARVMLARGAELRSMRRMQQGEYQSALDWAEQGLRYLERLPNNHPEVATTRVKLQYALATAAPAVRSPEHATRAIRQAMRLLHHNPHPVIESELHIRRAVVAIRNNPPSSVRIVRRALPLIESTGARDRLAHALFLGGQAMIFCGDIPGALEWVERATGIAKQTQSISFLCGGLFNLGWIQSITGGWDQALAYFREAQQLALSYELRDRYIDLMNYEAEILTYRGDYAGARAIFDNLRTMGEQLNISFVIEIANNSIAYIDLMQGASTGDHGTGEALKTLAGPIDSMPAAHNVLEVASRWALLRDRGLQIEVDSAALLAVTQASIDFLCTHGYRIFQPYAFRVNAMASFHLGDPQIALDNISQGVRVARRIGYAHDLARCLFWRGKIRRAVDPQAAGLVRRDLNEATRLFESLGARPELEQTLALLGEIAP